jgi:hypothetical protein
VNRAVAACLLLLASAGCSGGGARAPIDAAVRQDAPPADTAVMPGDPALCGCSILPDGTLSLFWSCYCGQSFTNCTAPLSPPSADCASQVRRDYPACGFTVITVLTSTGYQIPSVYDTSGNLVGRVSRSELSAYTCPSDPTNATLVSIDERAGQFPAENCEAVGCDPCYAGPFPCAPLVDAATGD